jgi:hypothetical protein
MTLFANKEDEDSGKLRKLHIEELHNFWFSQNTVKLVSQRV